jgi:hypothetical protein
MLCTRTSACSDPVSAVCVPFRLLPALVFAPEQVKEINCGEERDPAVLFVRGLARAALVMICLAT